ncbi:right-handed parallel beta-helix repeat-containing protein [Crossiella sp. SN42]|uniref:right-handed parallel beta-helix repeat-containing protein n=1 Tax=Crossiella sp. SN42 TaxID=2944808 RepID=UPI00207CDE68|nr:right-handed parallel beta-helix repeat-containing protein [Crossiella sp. SN42]MCO1574950.1 right-handed parallel beta-helix repeat-containing protein [Crossiella sp. SN42]
MPASRAVLASLGAVALTASVLNAPSAAAQTREFHLDCSAQSFGQGTAEAPWNRLEQANAFTFVPGDRLLLRRGTECAGVLKPRGSGSSTSPIRLGAYGEGAKPHIAGGGARAAVHLNNVQYWEIRDLRVSNSGPQPGPEERRAGIHVTLTDFGVGHHYVVADVEVHDVNGSDHKDPDPSGGILFSALGSQRPTRFQDVLIERNKVTRVDRTGIGTTSLWAKRSEHPDGPGSSFAPIRDLVVRDNVVTDVGGDGIVPQNTLGALVERNRVHKFNMRSSGWNAGIWAWNSDDTVIQYNEVSGGFGVRDSMAFDFDGASRNVLYQYNYSHDNDGGALLVCNAEGAVNDGGVFRHNISQHDGHPDVAVINIACARATNVRIHHNTFFTARNTRMVANYKDTQVVAANNVFARADGNSAIEDQHGRYLANAYLNVPVPERDARAVTGDPRLVNPGSASGLLDLGGYRLRAGSPALRAGEPVPAAGNRDVFGNPMPSVPNIGAYQGPGVNGD